MEQEYNAFNALYNTKLKPFLANNYEFDFESKILKHEFINGKDGEYYLFNHIQLNEIQIDSLKKFYLFYKEIKDDIILDIHPGNFIWDEKRNSWVLIDLGVLPTIGKEYYEFENFDDYYNNIWLNREKTMDIVPIRSMDFSLDFDVKDKVKKYE